MRRISRRANGLESGPSSFPFPLHAARQKSGRRAEEFADTPDGVLAAFADVSRRIDHLARELKCLGYFDDDGDRPRAA